MQYDGNLVLYKHYGNVGGTQTVCGKSNTTAYPGAHAYMNSGGNKSLSVYDTHGKVRWTTSPATDGWGNRAYVGTNIGGKAQTYVTNAAVTEFFVFWQCWAPIRKERNSATPRVGSGASFDRSPGELDRAGTAGSVAEDPAVVPELALFRAGDVDPRNSTCVEFNKR